MRSTSAGCPVQGGWPDHGGAPFMPRTLRHERDEGLQTPTTIQPDAPFMRSQLAHEWAATNALVHPRLHQPPQPQGPKARQHHSLGRSPGETTRAAGPTMLPQAQVKAKPQRPNCLPQSRRQPTPRKPHSDAVSELRSPSASHRRWYKPPGNLPPESATQAAHP